MARTCGTSFSIYYSLILPAAEVVSVRRFVTLLPVEHLSSAHIYFRIYATVRANSESLKHQEIVSDGVIPTGKYSKCQGFVGSPRFLPIIKRECSGPVRVGLPSLLRWKEEDPKMAPSHCPWHVFRNMLSLPFTTYIYMAHRCVQLYLIGLTLLNFSKDYLGWEEELSGSPEGDHRTEWTEDSVRLLLSTEFVLRAILKCVHNNPESPQSSHVRLVRDK